MSLNGWLTWRALNHTIFTSLEEVRMAAVVMRGNAIKRLKNFPKTERLIKYVCTKYAPIIDLNSTHKYLTWFPFYM